MIGWALLTLWAHQAPCEDVFDKTSMCAAPRVAHAGDVGADAPADNAHDDTDVADALAPRFWAGAAGVALLGVSAATLGFAYERHAEQLRTRAEPDAGALAASKLWEQGFYTAALGCTLGSVLLAGTAGAFGVFDPARGGLRPGIPPLEE